MKLKSVLYLLTLNTLLVLQSPSTVKAGTWWENDMGGCGEDIAAASSTSAWVLGCSDYINGGFEVWRWSGTQWISTGGRGKRIAVSPEGIPWVVAKDGTIWWYRKSDASWQHVDGCATDIGVGNNNSVWIVGCTVGRNGYHIRKWTGTGWQTLGDAGMEIAVSPSGIPWVVAEDGAIFKRNGNTWQHVDGCAKDIGVGNNNSIWVLGCKPGGG
jgi:hypothetical protein